MTRALGGLVAATVVVVSAATAVVLPAVMFGPSLYYIAVFANLR